MPHATIRVRSHPRKGRTVKSHTRLAPHRQGNVPRTSTLGAKGDIEHAIKSLAKGEFASAAARERKRRAKKAAPKARRKHVRKPGRRKR